MMYDSQRGKRIYLKRTHEMRFVNVFEKSQTRKTCRDEEPINGRKLIENAIIFVGEIELLYPKFGMVLFRNGEISIDYPDCFGVRLVSKQVCKCESDATCATYDEGIAHRCKVFSNNNCVSNGSRVIN